MVTATQLLALPSTEEMGKSYRMLLLLFMGKGTKFREDILITFLWLW